MSIIIDRRKNDRRKSAINRQRFLRRYKAQIRKGVGEIVAKRSIEEMEQGGKVKIPRKDISEPRFRFGQGGDREMVHPGNKEFAKGDKLRRPDGGPGEGGGDGEASDGGSGEDDFTFTLSREEFMNLFFDDLELPRLARTAIGTNKEVRWRRAGFKPSGTPASLSVIRSMRNAKARNIALRAPLKRQLQEARDAGDEERVEELERRLKRIPWLDEFDLRFHHRVAEPVPITQAAMFCLMDVSASMDESKKDLAKRFFTLLYLFLTRKYDRVQLVFIRHTSDAEEVDEQTFFHDPKTGGTVVLSALQLMSEIIEERYDLAHWNIYGAQVSDGDAFGADIEKSRGWLETQLLPALRYFAYIETPGEEGRKTPLSGAYQRIADERFAMRCVVRRSDVYPVLRDLFARETGQEQVA